jgi:hypothetical protein
MSPSVVFGLGDTSKSNDGGSQEFSIKLDPIVVLQQELSFEQEATLRFVRSAYNQSRSDRIEDRDKWICWLERPTGSSFKRLGCARNGDLWALRPNTAGVTTRLNQTVQKFEKPFLGTAGYGNILVSTRPVNQKKLERALAALSGSNEFDDEFLAMVKTGMQPPRDIPDNEELLSFAKAWLQVDKAYRARKNEDTQIAAIDAQGLTLLRYNRIAELVETYQSIENEVAEQIAALR